ncbi:hypothetical protein TWF970_010177 [Orbilia oligospora]|uniref:Peptidase S8/S53 domain-containing protein n=2 Tax=Orbilia oligospora TaxID=2813651 RepID=A0A7C8UZR1_ORBOL|nr:hypothetical protein TWF970_010177 [Orbilia oligospora]
MNSGLVTIQFATLAGGLNIINEPVTSKRPLSRKETMKSFGKVGVEDKKGGARPMSKKKIAPENRADITNKHECLLRDLLWGTFQDDDKHTMTKIDLSQYAGVLEKSGYRRSNLLHTLVWELTGDRDPYQDDQDRPDSEVYDEGVPEANVTKRALELVEYLVVLNAGLMCQYDDSRSVPLELFATSYPTILFGIIDMLPSDIDLETMLRKCNTTSTAHATSDNICPLKKLNGCLRDSCLNSDVKNGLEPHKSHCIHPMINTSQLRTKITHIKETIQRFLVSSGNKPNIPQDTFIHVMLGKESFDTAVMRNDQTQLRSFKTILKFFPTAETSVLNQPDSKGYNPLQKAITLFKEGALNYELLYKTIKILVKYQPDSIYFRTKDHREESLGRTAYTLLKEMKPAIGKRAEPFWRKAENLLKKTCIRDRDPRDPNGEKINKIEYLYSDIRSERQIRFDLGHETSTIIDEDYVDFLREKAAMQFESILECVKLPFRTRPVARDSEDPLQYEDRVNRYKTADPYISVFDWLKRDGMVQKIFAIEVDDLGNEPLKSTLTPHSNFAIRDCLRNNFKSQAAVADNKSTQTIYERDRKGMGIEIWNWRKLDICSDTIREAAPGVRILHLYSSANKAVLKGWACKDGLRTLKNLQTVRVVIYPKNSRDEADCKEYIPAFESKLRKRNAALEVEVFLEPSPKGKGSGENATKNQANSQQSYIYEAETQTDWIQSISRFKTCVRDTIDAISRDLGPNASAPVVKVAIIDDGVILADDGVQGIVRGSSFDFSRQPYFGERSRHGTHMVSSLREVCPMAELYIGRLDDTRSTDGQRFTVKSAIQALEWATKWEVDIISMSWSFKLDNSSCTREEGLAFKNAIDNAVAQGIILFGAMPDKGPIAEDIKRRYPVGLDNVIRITAAAKSGERLKFNQTDVPELLFPGDEVEIGSEESVKITGSSVATALAAGFAALTILCIKLQAAGMLDRSVQAAGTIPRAIETDLSTRLRALRTPGGIRTIFRNVSPKLVNSKDSFVQPHTALPDDIKAGLQGREEAIKFFLNRIV